MTEDHDWLEEGKKHFVASKIRPDKPPSNYPTQDVHLPKDEAEFITGYNLAKNAFDRGEGFSGLESYANELDEQRKTEQETKR